MQLAAGSGHNCALLEDGNVRCWGNGEYGQLGYGETFNVGDNETPAEMGDVDVGGTVVQLASGGATTCALLEGGTVRCWGYGASGQLGYGDIENIGDDEVPADAGDVDVGGTVVQLTVSGATTCALLEEGSVRCWGMGMYGSLGYGDIENIGDDEVPADAGDVPLL